MRNNQPVTKTEYEIRQDVTLVSKTDINGRITFANQNFIEVSGYSREELIGEPHNIVRHPDMPREAFADLWATLKAGNPWTGAVKNRRKNGDFYWVLASATPVWENGQVTGFMSIRTKLSAEHRREAEKGYALFRTGRADGLTIRNGLVRKQNRFSWLSFFTASIKRRLMTLSICLLAFMMIVGGVGLNLSMTSQRRVGEIYAHHTEPLAWIAEINDRMGANLIRMSEAASGHMKPADAARAVAANVERITSLWSSFSRIDLQGEEATIAKSYATRRAAFVEQGIRATIAMLEAGRLEEASAHLSRTTMPLFEAAKAEAEKLMAIRLAAAKASQGVAEAEFRSSLILSLVVFLLAAAIGAALCVTSIRAVLAPIGRLVTTMKLMSKGNFNNAIVIDREDEFGAALHYMQATQSKFGYDTELSREAEQALQARARRLESLVAGFDSTVSDMLRATASSADEMRAAARSLGGSAETTANQASAVTSASEAMSSNMQTVAAATEEISGSIGEIGRQATQSTQIVARAVEEAGRAGETIRGLSEAAERIGNVVKLINEIAGQTNLLALNATIEAARAGEAGKGFAVVASEVKSLAKQTAQATEDISGQVAGVQNATQEAVRVIGEVAKAIDEVRQTASSIAAAVEEQGAATTEIARNVQEAARGTEAVSTNIAGVTKAAGDTGAAATQVLGAAEALSGQAATLRGEVDRFFADVKAG